MLVSQALLVTFMFSMPCSLLADWPKTCLSDRVRSALAPPTHRQLETHRYLDERTKRDIIFRSVAHEHFV